MRNQGALLLMGAAMPLSLQPKACQGPMPNKSGLRWGTQGRIQNHLNRILLRPLEKGKGGRLPKGTADFPGNLTVTSASITATRKPLALRQSSSIQPDTAPQAVPGTVTQDCLIRGKAGL